MVQAGNQTSMQLHLWLWAGPAAMKRCGSHSIASQTVPASGCALAPGLQGSNRVSLSQQPKKQVRRCQLLHHLLGC